MDVYSLLQQQLLTHQLDSFEPSSFNTRKLNWVCALGKHQGIWDYMILGSFEDCLDHAWGILQHEVKPLKNQFKSKLRKNKGYIGQFAEIKKLPQKCSFSSGMAIGNSMIIFDHPEKIAAGLSKPVYAAFYSHCPDVIFGHQIFQGLSTEKLLGQLAQWTNLSFLGNKLRL